MEAHTHTHTHFTLCPNRNVSTHNVTETRCVYLLNTHTVDCEFVSQQGDSIKTFTLVTLVHTLFCECGPWVGSRDLVGLFSSLHRTGTNKQLSQRRRKKVLQQTGRAEEKLLQQRFTVPLYEHPGCRSINLLSRCFLLGDLISADRLGGVKNPHV